MIYMKSFITTIIFLLITLSATNSFAQTIDSRNKVEFIDESSSTSNLNSIKAIVKETPKGSIKIKSLEKEPVKTSKKVISIKKGQDISVADLEKIANQRSNMRYRNVRKRSNKCFVENADCKKK